MPSQISITRKCQILKEQCAQLRLQVDAEQRRQDYLLLRHNLLQVRAGLGVCVCLRLNSKLLVTVPCLAVRTNHTTS